MLDPLVGLGRTTKMIREPLDLFGTHFWLQISKSLVLGRMKAIPFNHNCSDPGPFRVAGRGYHKKGRWKVLGKEVRVKVGAWDLVPALVPMYSVSR